MNQIKALFFTLLFVLVMIFAVQNVQTLSVGMPMKIDWPGIYAYSVELPLYVLIAIVFAVGFVLTSLTSLGERRALGRHLSSVRRRIGTLERELSPPAQPLSPSSPKVLDESAAVSSKQDRTAAQIADSDLSPQHLHTTSEHAMESSASTPPSETRMSEQHISSIKDDQDILIRQPGPGWAAVLLLSAAMALVVSSGVYIVFNDQFARFTEQQDELQIRSGHLLSTQEEMARSWEQERAILRDEIGALSQGQTHLGETVETLEQQMAVVSRMPEELRNRFVAGSLRDTAGKTAYLETQVETDAQRETLLRVQEMLEALAAELEGGDSLPE